MVDSVEAVDQDVTRRRELLALRLAVQAGRVERARLAAERLFGLRLDSSHQVQLAAQMQQLGMHELAEAVLARARRRAGNNEPALVGLMLQYQRQGKADAAVQIAHQLLRRSGNAPLSRATDLDSPAKRQAIQVLARSGKLDETIERLEAQLRQSPESLQLHQSLAAYYRAAGKSDKVRAISEAMVKLRPDDGRLRMQVALELVRAGDSAAALDQIRKALKFDPALFGGYRVEIHNAFHQQHKLAELVAARGQVGAWKASGLGQAYVSFSLAQALLQNPATIDRGMTLWRKIWDTFPADRITLLSNLSTTEEFWTRPEAYDYLLDVLIPAPAVSRVDPWLGLDERTCSCISRGSTGGFTRWGRGCSRTPPAAASSTIWRFGSRRRLEPASRTGRRVRPCSG